MPARKAPVRKTAAKRPKHVKAGKRELIQNAAGKFYGKRRAKGPGKGQFREMDEVTKSLRADRAKKAKTKAKPGYKDQGD